MTLIFKTSIKSIIIKNYSIFYTRPPISTHQTYWIERTGFKTTNLQQFSDFPCRHNSVFHSVLIGMIRTGNVLILISLRVDSLAICQTFFIIIFLFCKASRTGNIKLMCKLLLKQHLASIGLFQTCLSSCQSRYRPGTKSSSGNSSPVKTDFLMSTVLLLIWSYSHCNPDNVS